VTPSTEPHRLQIDLVPVGRLERISLRLRGHASGTAGQDRRRLLRAS
jgi:hypothetical protein